MRKISNPVIITFIILLTIIGIVAGVILVRQQQNLKPQAADAFAVNCSTTCANGSTFSDACPGNSGNGGSFGSCQQWANEACSTVGSVPSTVNGSTASQCPGGSSGGGTGGGGSSSTPPPGPGCTGGGNTPMTCTGPGTYSIQTCNCPNNTSTGYPGCVCDDNCVTTSVTLAAGQTQTFGASRPACGSVQVDVNGQGGFCIGAGQACEAPLTTPTSTATSTPTPSPTPTGTATPSPTPSSTPTVTSTPTPTPQSSDEPTSSTSTPQPTLPASGSVNPTIFGVGIGVILLLASVVFMI